MSKKYERGDVVSCMHPEGHTPVNVGPVRALHIVCSGHAKDNDRAILSYPNLELLFLYGGGPVTCTPPVSEVHLVDYEPQGTIPLLARLPEIHIHCVASEAPSEALLSACEFVPALHLIGLKQPLRKPGNRKVYYHP